MRVLILEDDPLIGLDLQWIVEAERHTVVSVCDSIARARCVIDEELDFALLDIDVADGKSFELALALRHRNVPFAFVSASRRSDLPLELRDVPFVAKPYLEDAIVRVLARGREERRRPSWPSRVAAPFEQPSA